MFNDRRNAQRIASDLIAEIALEWAETPASRCIQIDGYYVFEFVIEPIRYVRFLRRPHDPLSGGDSTVRFNPLSEATEIVLEHTDKLRAMNAELRDDITRRQGKDEIRQMLAMAPQVFQDAIWQTRIVAETLKGIELMRVFGRPDRARVMLNSALDAIRDRLKKRLGPVSTKRNPKINQFTLNKALKTFLPKFKASGELPSQRQFAKALDVTPKAYRSFLANHHLDKHELTIKQWYNFILAKESDSKPGTYSIDKVPMGTND